MPINRRLTRLAALAGLIGPLFFSTVLIGLTFAEYDFMRGLGWRPLRVIDWPSGLALGPYGLWLTIAFPVSGLLMAFFGLGLRGELKDSTMLRIGTLGLLVAGGALAGLVFHTDPTFRSYPKTWHGLLHDAFFVLLGLALLASMLTLARAFRSDPRWKGYGLYTDITAAFALPSFALKGVAFYVFLAAIQVWGFVIALKLWHLTSGKD